MSRAIGRPVVGPFSQPPQQRPVAPQGFGGTSMVPYQPAPQSSPPPDHAASGGAPWGPDIRRAIGGFQQRLEETLGVLNGQLGDHEARIQELVRVKHHDALGGLQPAGGLNSALGQAFLSGNPALQRAVYTGRCLPYNAVVDIFVPAGICGQLLEGSIFVTQDGPVFISQVLAYAMIDKGDQKAKNFPSSLITPPLCTEGADPLGINETATFTLDSANLLPDMDVSGRYIPVSPRNCPLIPLGTDIVCGTLSCEDQADKRYNVRRPIAMLSHPDCFDGLVQISTNDCGWQSVPYPIAMLEDAAFDITNESPDCIGVCGFVDCNKVLQVGITPTHASRFDINVQIVFAGFRVLTCGGPACSTG